MAAVSHTDLLEQLRWRYAVKKFDPTRSIPADVWHVLEQTLVLTPSSYGLQPWRFEVVTDPAIKRQLPALSWGQSQVVDASHVVVFAIRSPLTVEHVERYIERITEVRGTPPDALRGFQRMIVQSIEQAHAANQLDEWNARQVYIALGSFMTAAALLGIDTCPMEGIEHARYDEFFDLTSAGYKTAVVCVAGYRAADDRAASQAKVRFKTDDVIGRRS